MLMDTAQTALDEAAAKYRRAYNRGYSLSEQGEDRKAQRILDRANAEYDAAKRVFHNDKEVAWLKQRGRL